jgi:hypothetical protein
MVGGLNVATIAPRRIAACAALLLMTSCGSSSLPTNAKASSSPASSPTPLPTLSKTFTSPMMGYSLKYPADWMVIPATATWKPGATDYWNDPELDKLNGKTIEFRGTSQPLAPGQTDAAWMNAYLALSPPCGSQEQVSIGGQTGTLDANGCPGAHPFGGLLYDLAVVAGGRGYDFAAEGNVDHSIFLALLATVTFSPKSATP